MPRLRRLPESPHHLASGRELREGAQHNTRPSKLGRGELNQSLIEASGGSVRWQSVASAVGGRHISYSANQSFVNGTSTIEDLGSNAIVISEVPMPLGVNESSEFAHDILTPGISKVCTIPKPGSNSSSAVQCQTSTDQSNYPNDYIVTQNGLSILVNPSGNIQWADGRRGVGVGIERPAFEREVPDFQPLSSLALHLR